MSAADCTLPSLPVYSVFKTGFTKLTTVCSGENNQAIIRKGKKVITSHETPHDVHSKWKQMLHVVVTVECDTCLNYKTCAAFNCI